VSRRSAFLANYNCGPVRRDLAHQVGDLIAIETHRQHRIAAPLECREPQPLDSMITAIAEQLGIAVHFAAEDCSQPRTPIGKSVARPDDQAEDLAEHRDYLIAGQIIGGNDDHAIELRVGIHELTVTAVQVCGNAFQVSESQTRARDRLL
jgi:hypothetical protein